MEESVQLGWLICAVRFLWSKFDFNKMILDQPLSFTVAKKKSVETIRHWELQKKAFLLKIQDTILIIQKQKGILMVVTLYKLNISEVKPL